VFDVALLAIPLLACLLDAKIMEYGLHARVISRFIEDEFASPSIVARWERTLWGFSDLRFQRTAVKVRSLTTVLVTVIPTLLIIAMDTVLIYVRRRGGWILLAGVVICLIYVVVTALVVRIVWPTHRVGQSPLSDGPS
jgi:hypothetical protein